MPVRTHNAQYNIAAPDSLAVRVATRVRAAMFHEFMARLRPGMDESVLDIGVTSDQSYTSSNYFEMLYPHRDQITAVGIDDARFLETLYPGVRFAIANALNLPFKDDAFDLVHSSAVLEHVGSFANQVKMIAEMLRVARRGVYLTTPNRWFPIEFHTVMPLLHWLPKWLCRAAYRRMGLGFFADEANLNLMSTRDLRRIGSLHPDWSFAFAPAYLWGWKSNLVMVGERRECGSQHLTAPERAQRADQLSSDTE